MDDDDVDGDGVDEDDDDDVDNNGVDENDNDNDVDNNDVDDTDDNAVDDNYDNDYGDSITVKMNGNQPKTIIRLIEGEIIKDLYNGQN